MTNPIKTTTADLLSELGDDAKLASLAVQKFATLMTGDDILDLEDAINMFKAAKYLASRDGFSRSESRLLSKLIPNYIGTNSSAASKVIEHVAEFDCTVLLPEHVGELAAPRSRKACFMYSAMVSVAEVDGFTMEERELGQLCGAALGLDRILIDLITAEAILSRQVGTLTLERKPEAEFRAMRQAILALMDD